MIIDKCDDIIIVKVFKEYCYDIDVYDKEYIKDFFKEIFVKLKDKYDLNGIFDVDVYVNLEYGMIIEICPICDFLDDIDMRIKFHIDSIFLVIINTNSILDYNDVYYYMGKFYGTYLGLCDSEIIYKDVDKIIKNGIKVC